MTLAFLKNINEVREYRRPGMVAYPLDEILGCRDQPRLCPFRRNGRPAAKVVTTREKNRGNRGYCRRRVRQNSRRNRRLAKEKLRLRRPCPAYA
jgi:hypothetical protein